MLAVQPIGSAALSRMPRALESLAVWPVVSGLMFMLRCPGHAYQEVVVALSDSVGAVRPLKRFAKILTFAMITALFLFGIIDSPCFPYHRNFYLPRIGHFILDLFRQVVGYFVCIGIRNFFGSDNDP